MLKSFTMFFLSLSFAGATSFTLTNNQNSSRFLCQPTDGNGGGGVSTDPECTHKVRTLCDDKTSYSDDDCFNRAADVCRRGANPDCVTSTFAECDDQTSYSDDRCFDESVKACGGSYAAFQGLMHAATEKALRDARTVERK